MYTFNNASVYRFRGHVKTVKKMRWSDRNGRSSSLRVRMKMRRRLALLEHKNKPLSSDPDSESL